MILSVDDLKKYLSNNPVNCFVRVIEGHHNGSISDLKELTRFAYLYADTPTELNEKLLSLLSEFPNKYTLLLSEKTNSTPSHIQVSSNSVAEPIQGTVKSNIPIVDEEKLRASILAEIESKKAQEDKDREIQELKQQLKQAEEPGHKLVFVLEQLLFKIMKPAVPVNGGLNSAKMEVSEDQLEQALADLIDALGEETIVKLASKLKQPGSDSIISIVNNYANS